MADIEIKREPDATETPAKTEPVEAPKNLTPLTTPRVTNDEESAFAETTIEESITEQIDEAVALKNEANTFFKAHNYDKAIALYTESIEKHPEPVPAAFYSNRSFAYLKNDCPAAALKDADDCLAVDKNFIKGYYRRASANMILRKTELALKDFSLVAKFKPKDVDARKKKVACEKLVQRERFMKAIGSQEDLSGGDSSLNEKIEDFENFDLETIKLEADYKGPVYEKDEDMTPAFCLKLMEWHKDQKKFPKKYLWRMLQRVLKQFKGLDSLVDVPVSDDHHITVCGDTHGQYYDLCNIFELNGMPSETNPYLFNGDFVDRGSFSVEVIVTMLAFKCMYPGHFHMTRGNHETKNMNELYGFQGEVTAKYDVKTYDFFTEIFNWLPLSYCLNSSTEKKVFITHGGLFENMDVTLDDIRKTERNRQPPESGIMTDALWADPCMSNGRQPSKRGTSIQFGPNITEDFCVKNKLEYIIRSHEVKEEGYEEQHNKRCYTIFSAPNYCDQMGNKGAYIHIKGPDMKPKFNQFDAVPHPQVKAMQFSNPMLRLAGLM